MRTRTAFKSIAEFGFVEALRDDVGEEEQLSLFVVTGLALCEATGLQPEATTAFLRSMRTGRAFGLTLLSHLTLDPEHGPAKAMEAAIAGWRTRRIDKDTARRDGLVPGMESLAGWIIWAGTFEAASGPTVALQLSDNRAEEGPEG